VVEMHEVRLTPVERNHPEHEFAFCWSLTSQYP
jgi:hypothetical protein